jgi:parallel beta-helix repeat protein
MNDLPRRKLRELVARDSGLIAENPPRTESLLRDYCGEFRREISVLVMALEEHAVADMLSAPKSLPLQVLFGRLAQRLCDNLALSESAARWSIESWALAFGLISENELSASETEQTKKQNPIEPAANVSPKIVKTAASPTAQPKPTASTQTAKAASTSYVVSASGGNFSTISEALRNVAPNSRLLIREDFYKESILLDKPIEIVGDGAVENIIVESANSSCVSMQTDRATVRGLSLSGIGEQNGKSFFAVDIPRGELILENCDIISDSLSCVAIHGAYANPLIRNCRIHDGADSGFYIFDNARGRIEESDVYHNKNVGVAITGGANPTIKNCRIFEGASGGVVVWQNGAAGEIENCEIFGHRLANVAVSDSANPTFLSCKIFGGLDSGVMVHQNGYGKFEDCAVHDNRKAEFVVIEKSNSVLRRCAIYNGTDSGIFVDKEARALIESCNIYDNSEAGIAIRGASVVAVRQCNIHRNGVVAVSVKQRSAASVENCDLRGNRVAAWETEGDVVVERKNNRE